MTLSTGLIHGLLVWAAFAVIALAMGVVGWWTGREYGREEGYAEGRRWRRARES